MREYADVLYTRIRLAVEEPSFLGCSCDAATEKGGE